MDRTPKRASPYRTVELPRPESGGVEERVEQARRVADAVDASMGGGGDVAQVLAGEVDELDAFEVGPDLLDGVEVRGVGRQAFDHKPPSLRAQPGLHRAGAV